MNSIMLSFLITILAGFSTMIGVFPIYFRRKSQDVLIPICLSFAAGVMISISLFSLIPEAIEAVSQSFVLFPAILIVSIFIVVGVLFSSFVDQKIEKKFANNQLYKLGLISVIALMFHNIPEGITTFISSNQDLRLGIILALAAGIMIHISIYELIPTAYQYSIYLKTSLAFLLGFFVMLSCQYFI